MFYDKFLAECNKRNIKPSVAAVEMGFQKSVATRWKNGTKPTDANLLKVADYFELPPEYFKEPQNKNVSAESSVEIVKSICKERNIPIARLEKDLGFANGYISQLRKGVFPSDRFAQIAEYLNVTEDFLRTGQNTPAASGKGVTEDEMKIALFGGADEVTDEMWEEAKFAIELIKDRYKRKLESNAGAVQDSGTGKH